VAVPQSASGFVAILILLGSLSCSLRLRGIDSTGRLSGLPHTPGADRNSDEEVSQSWSRVETLPAGVRIKVVTKNGERIKGKFKGSHPNGLTVDVSDAEERNIPKQIVRKVMLHSGNKGLWIGALVGFGAGVGIAFAVSEQADIATRITIPVFGGLGAGGGALLGYFLGRRGRKEMVLYEAP